MADFKTHITVSSVVGVGYGALAYAQFDVPLPSCLLAGGLCGVSGMLPDIDSDSGVPLRESLAFAAAVVPMMLIHRLAPLGLAPESLILAGAATYLLIRFGVSKLLKLYTVHRGMFHSIPAALIFGELAFLISNGSDAMRCYKAGAVVLGYLSHLILDEIWSFQVKGGRIRLKSSFGTAIKMVGPSWWSNISVYGKLALLTYMTLQEPMFLRQPQMTPASSPAAKSETAPDIGTPAKQLQQAFTDLLGRLRR